MRARNVKPGFFKNELLIDLPYEYRLLFVGLWCLADREGRLENRPKRIKMEIFPCDDVDIVAGLASLASKDFIKFYSVGDGNYIQIKNFLAHQRPHHTEKKSVIPAPVEITVNSLLSNGGNLPDSPNPYSLNHESLSPAAPNRRAELERLFDLFWSVYPKKKSKGHAQKVFFKIAPTEQLVATMVASIERAKTSDQWSKDQGKFIPHPATWLNAEGWLDEDTSPTKSALDEWLEDGKC
jgi:hypothetical protein